MPTGAVKTDVRIIVPTAGSPKVVSKEQFVVAPGVGAAILNSFATSTDYGLQPDAFTFADQTSVSLSSVITSAPITITGIGPGLSAPISITVDGSGDSQYRINGGLWTSIAGTISNGDQLEVRHTSSGSNSISVNTEITIGTPSRSDTFTSTTEIATGTQSLWKTSFNYPGTTFCTQRGNGGYDNCALFANDGISWSWGNTGTFVNYPGHTDVMHASASIDANYAHGEGGLGYRTWTGDGTNIGNGPVRYDFPEPLTEFWMRWYHKYQAGYSWAAGYGTQNGVNLPHYDKLFYMNTNGGLSIFPSQPAQQTFTTTLQGGGVQTQQVSTGGFFGSFGVTDNFVLTCGNGTQGSDGEFHLFEIYFKMDTVAISSTEGDGIGKIWVDGKLVAENNAVNYSGGSSTSRQGFTWMQFASNQNAPDNGPPFYEDLDDIEIWNTTPPNLDKDRDPWIGPYLKSSDSMSHTTTFTETCEDTNFTARGWYDGVGVNTPTLASDTPLNTGSSCLEAAFTASGTSPSWTNARRAIPETDNVYLSYYVKYSEDWEGSGLNYHPHEMHFLTNKDGAFQGLSGGDSGNDLTLYMETNDRKPQVIYANVANPSSLGGVVTQATDKLIRGVWHRVEIYFKLNSISGGVGTADGIQRCWINGNLVINKTDALMRNGAGNDDMLINQFIIAPYIGDGSPVAQSIFYDQIIVGTE